MKQFIYLFVLFMVSWVSCTPEKTEVTLSSILTQGNGTWKVAYAKFGDEEAPRDMYSRFQITFKNGTYTVTNPDGAVIFVLSTDGSWQATSNAKSLLFDAKTTVREVSTVLNPAKLILEWEVSIPGKVTTTYRIELIRG